MTASTLSGWRRVAAALALLFVGVTAWLLFVPVNAYRELGRTDEANAHFVAALRLASDELKRGRG